MPPKSRALLVIGVCLAYVLILALPFTPSRALDQLGGWIGARWRPRLVAIDARVLEASALAVSLVLVLSWVEVVRRRLLAASAARVCTRLHADREQQRRVHAILQGRLSDWVERSYPIRVRCDVDGRFLTLAESVAGSEPVDLHRISLDELPDPVDRDALRSVLDRARAGYGTADPIEVAIDEGHDSRWLELRLRLETDPDEGDMIRGVARDVTESKHRQQEAGVRRAIEEAWRGHSPVERELEGVLAKLLEAFRGELAEFWWVDDAFGVLRHGASSHGAGRGLAAFVRAASARTFGKGLGLAGRVWADATVVRVDSLADDLDPRCAKLAEATPFRSAVGFPIRLADHIIGVVVLLFGRTRAGPIGSPQLERLGLAIGHLVDHKRHEQSLHDDEARKNAVLESALDCVITIDERGRIVEFNPAAQRTFGRSRGQVLGQPMADVLIPEEYRGAQAEAFRRCLEPGARRFSGRRLETEGLRADGTRFPIEISVTSTHVGRSLRFTAFLRDITERKELDRLKDDLVSTVSHELRTPLTSMRGFVELLLTREFPRSERQRFLEIVETETKRLGKLIDDFLDLQRLGSGALDCRFEQVVLQPLVAEAIEMFEHTSAEHEYLAELPAEEVRVEADADRVRQVLRNLLSNATKYSPDGGRVTVRARVTRKRVRVAVCDEGIGMDPETQQKLFSRFYRADSTATRRIGGTGLGLALVKEIVEAHGGEVGVQSEPGRGSEFFFELPLYGERA